MRRGADRVEDAIAWLLTALGLVVIIVAGMIAVGSYVEGKERAGADQADRVQATAVLLTDAGDQVSEQGSAAPFARVPARWTDSSGRQHEGQVLARTYSHAGAEVPVWLDRNGELASPPASELNVLLDGVAIGVTVLMLGGSLIAGAWIGLRRIIFAHNTRAWEREWARIGPEWTSQQPK
jgi:hypothetical protein